MRRALTVIPLLALVALAPAADKDKAAGVYKANVKSVAWIVRVGPGGAYTGSGALIDLTDRLVLTNYHVVRDDESAFVFFPQYEKGNLVNQRAHYERLIPNAPKGKVVARDPKRDLALIRLDALPPGAKAIRLAKSSCGPTDHIHCIGNPGLSGGLWTYTPGDVKNVAVQRFKSMSKGRPEDSFVVEARMLETNATINAGDSGGPVFNDAGEQVGVSQGHAVGEGPRAITFAVDLSEVKSFLKEKKFIRALMAPQTPTMLSAADGPKPPAVPADPKAEAEKRESAAAFKVDSARNLIARDKKDDARAKLEDVIKTYPETKAADEARKLLAEFK